MNHTPMPKPVSTPEYDIAFDPAKSIVRIVIRGFWTPEIMQAYLTDLDTFLIPAMANFGMARVLLDRRDSPVQAANVQQLANERFGRSDLSMKMAMLTESSLVQMQIRRSAASKLLDFFTDITEAEAWLLGE